jgi:hypothetical protein
MLSVMAPWLTLAQPAAGAWAAWLSALLIFGSVGCAPTSRADATRDSSEDAGATILDGEPGDRAVVVRDAAASADVAVPWDAPALITEEEWRRRTAPIEGEHEIIQHAGYGCPPQRIAQEFRVLPAVGCYPRAGAATVYDCDVGPFCLRHADCTAQPFGRCRGSNYAECVYPMANTTCSTALDCTAVPNGFCDAVPPTGTLCYPTGRCETSQPRCRYPAEDCTSDADCTTVAGGTCQKLIVLVRCGYQDCMVDADCGQGMRCPCATYGNGSVCVPADCHSDSDCGDGQTCRLELGCNRRVIAHHCSTALDTCRTNEDCGVNYCVFKGSWQCEAKLCPIGP